MLLCVKASMACRLVLDEPGDIVGGRRVRFHRGTLSERASGQPNDGALRGEDKALAVLASDEAASRTHTFCPAPVAVADHRREGAGRVQHSGCPVRGLVDPLEAPDRGGEVEDRVVWARPGPTLPARPRRPPSDQRRTIDVA